MTGNVTREELQAAMAVLERYGQSERRSRGAAIGYALYSMLNPNEIYDATIEALEQWNCHVTVAALTAMGMPMGDRSDEKRRGSWKRPRKSRTLTITLPEHWEDI